MGFSLEFCYDEEIQDVVAMLAVDPDATMDLAFANLLAKTLFNLNNGAFKETCVTLVKEKFIELGQPSVAATIFDSWQKLLFMADNEPDVNAEDVYKNGPIVF